MPRRDQRGAAGHAARSGQRNQATRQGHRKESKEQGKKQIGIITEMVPNGTE
jgi:hypothetical protein